MSIPENKQASQPGWKVLEMIYAFCCPSVCLFIWMLAVVWPRALVFVCMSFHIDLCRVVHIDS